MATTSSTKASSASNGTRRLRAADADDARSPSRPRRVSAGVAAQRASEEFGELTGTPVERVTAVERTESGWLVVVEGLEMRRVPVSMDVIGVYEVELSGRGQVTGWRRVGRHHRGQVQEG